MNKTKKKKVTWLDNLKKENRKRYEKTLLNMSSTDIIKLYKSSTD